MFVKTDILLFFVYPIFSYFYQTNFIALGNAFLGLNCKIRKPMLVIQNCETDIKF